MAFGILEVAQYIGTRTRQCSHLAGDGILKGLGCLVKAPKPGISASCPQASRSERHSGSIAEAVSHGFRNIALLRPGSVSV